MTLSVYETCVFVCYFLRLFVEFSERMLDWTHAKAQISRIGGSKVTREFAKQAGKGHCISLHCMSLSLQIQPYSQTTDTLIMP